MKTLFLILVLSSSAFAQTPVLNGTPVEPKEVSKYSRAVREAMGLVKKWTCTNGDYNLGITISLANIVLLDSKGNQPLLTFILQTKEGNDLFDDIVKVYTTPDFRQINSFEITVLQTKEFNRGNLQAPDFKTQVTTKYKNECWNANVQIPRPVSP